LACSKKREVEKRGKERKKGREKKKKKKRQREKRKREKGRRKECGRAMAPHTQAARAHKQSRTLLLFLSKPLLLHSDRHFLTFTKGDVPCVPNHKALCQQIMPPMNMVPTHEARVPHTIATTTPRYPSYR